jgi:hypothetical protein
MGTAGRIARMTDKPAPTPPREPLRLPPNCRDVTAEKAGTVIGIVGATAADDNGRLRAIAALAEKRA